MKNLDINDAYFVLNEIRGIINEPINIRDKEIINRILNSSLNNLGLIENAAYLLHNTISNEPLTMYNISYAYALTEYYLNKNQCYININNPYVVFFMSNVNYKVFCLNCIERWLYKNTLKAKDEIKETIYDKSLILKLG